MSASRLPGWAWAIITLAALGGLLVIALLVIFLWPWIATIS